MFDRNRLLAAIGLRVAEVNESTGVILRLEKASPPTFPPSVSPAESSSTNQNHQDGQQPMDLESSSSEGEGSSSPSLPFSNTPSPASPKKDSGINGSVDTTQHDDAGKR